MVGRNLRYLSIAVAVAAVLIGLTAGYQRFFGTDSAGLPKGAITYKYLSSRPESRIVFPGSTLVRRLGGDELNALGGGSSGFAGGIFSTGASGEAVYSWYEGQLLGHGWRFREISALSTETSARAYVRGSREAITVGIDNPALLGNVVGQKMPTGMTLYEFTYSVDPSR
jgi:hypothetical protein